MAYCKWPLTSLACQNCERVQRWYCQVTETVPRVYNFFKARMYAFFLFIKV
jgi:hypothetical protein